MRGNVIFSSLVLLLVTQAEAALHWSYTDEDAPRKCATNCDFFGKSYKWCRVTKESWAKCIPGETILQEELQMADSNKRCVSLCRPAVGGSTNTNWCFTSVQPMEWKPCPKSDLQDIYLSIAEDNQLCRTKCDPVSLQCDVGFNNIKNCIPGDLPYNPPRARRGNCTSLCGKYKAGSGDMCQVANSWESCDGGNTIQFLNGLLGDRRPDQLLPEVLGFIKTTTSQRRVRRNFQKLVKDLACFATNPRKLTWFSAYFKSQKKSTRSSANPPYAKIDYVTTLYPDSFGEFRRRVHTIEATIKPENLRTAEDRVAYHEKVSEAIMKEMDAKAGDEKGHFVAQSLGGPSDEKNIVPQSRDFNRGGGWKRMELAIKAAMKKNENIIGRHIKFFQKLGYKGGSNRPTTYDVEWSLREGDGSIVPGHQFFHEFHDDGNVDNCNNN